MGGKLENWKLENWWDLEFESTIEAEYTKTVLSRTRVKARRAYVAISVIAVVIVLILDTLVVRPLFFGEATSCVVVVVEITGSRVTGDNRGAYFCSSTSKVILE